MQSLQLDELPLEQLSLGRLLIGPQSGRLLVKQGPLASAKLVDLTTLMQCQLKLLTTMYCFEQICPRGGRGAGRGP